MRSPFKFLDPFRREDAAIFFGRDEEVERLYDFVNKNRLILVYGITGTGKTSLVQCGLASRFDTTDWYPFFIRRRDDINKSLIDALSKAFPDSSEKSIPRIVERINSRYLRPVYLVFDQLEELLILGTPDEQETFIQTIQTLLQTDEDSDCHILFILREEFLARLYPIEQEIPTLFDRRLRVEPMSYSSLQEVIIRSFNRFNIELEDPKENVNQIITNLSAGKSGLSLPYLQVYLDMLWQDVRTRTNLGSDTTDSDKDYPNRGFPKLRFTTQEIQEFGQIDNVLSRFLTRQMGAIQAGLKKNFPELPDNAVTLILDCFVTAEGTKRPLAYVLEDDIIQLDLRSPELHSNLSNLVINEVLIQLDQSRLIRFTEDTIELAHDSLASLIDEQRSNDHRRLNEIYNRLLNNFLEYRESGEFLTRRQLTVLEEYLPQLEPRLDSNIQHFIESSLNEVDSKEKTELAALRNKRKRARQIAWITSVLSVLSISGFFLAISFNVRANHAKKEALEKQALAEDALKQFIDLKVLELLNTSKTYENSGDMEPALRVLIEAQMLDSMNQDIKNRINFLKNKLQIQ